MMSVILDTERLVLRKLTTADAGFVAELLNTPTWLRFIGDRGVRTIADAHNYIMNGPLLSYAVHGFGLYLAALKDSGQPIGMCGLLKRDYLTNMDIGYALLPEYVGKGYAYEITLATVNYAFNDLHLLGLDAITDTENERSIELLGKLGFVYKELLNIEGKDLMLYFKDARTYK